MNDHIEYPVIRKIYNDIEENAEFMAQHIERGSFTPERAGAFVSGIVIQHQDRAIVLRCGWTPDGAYVSMQGVDAETGDRVELTVLQLEESDVSVTVA